MASHPFPTVPAQDITPGGQIREEFKQQFDPNTITRDIEIGGKTFPLTFPAGTIEDEQIAIIAKLVSAQTTVQIPEPELEKGPLGAVDPELRNEIRKAVENQPFLKRVLFEATLPTVGTKIGGDIGGLVGSRFGPAGKLTGRVAGMGIGGFLFELFSEEVGISPKSKTAAITELVAPGIGVTGKKLAQQTGKGLSRGFEKLSPVTAAVERIRLEQASKGIDSMGARILSSKTGLLGKPAKVLYNTVKTAGIKLSPTDFSNAQRNTVALRKELQGFASFPEGAQALAALDTFEEVLRLKVPLTVDQRLAAAGIDATGPVKKLSQEVDLADVVKVRQHLGAAINKLETKAGVGLGSAKLTFAGLAEDMTLLAKRPDLTGSVATIAEAATKRAKLEFAINDFKGIIIKHTNPVSGQGDAITINAAGILTDLKNLTNPDSLDLNRNFVSALKEDLPAIIKVFQDINKIPVSPGGGAGSLVIRGTFAREFRAIGKKALLWGTLGAVSGGPLVGLVAGSFAVYGARFPETITAALLTPKGRAFLSRVATLGRGKLNPQLAGQLSQLVLGTAARAGQEGVEFAKETKRKIVQQTTKGLKAAGIKEPLDILLHPKSGLGLLIR